MVVLVLVLLMSDGIARLMALYVLVVDRCS